MLWQYNSSFTSLPSSSLLSSTLSYYNAYHWSSTKGVNISSHKSQLRDTRDKRYDLWNVRHSIRHVVGSSIKLVLQDQIAISVLSSRSRDVLNAETLEGSTRQGDDMPRKSRQTAIFSWILDVYFGDFWLWCLYSNFGWKLRSRAKLQSSTVPVFPSTSSLTEALCMMFWVSFGKWRNFPNVVDSFYGSTRAFVSL